MPVNKDYNRVKPTHSRRVHCG